MGQNVSQWLIEIRTLQRQLADTRKERDQALTSAANWRRLYETEARQRRQETDHWRSQIASQPTASQPPTAPVTGESEAAALSEDSLQAQLNAALERCQELTHRLEAERQAHDRTRKTLTTALGETFDTLKSKLPTHPDRPMPTSRRNSSSESP